MPGIINYNLIPQVKDAMHKNKVRSINVHGNLSSLHQF